jgi:hypothetical protein
MNDSEKLLGKISLNPIAFNFQKASKGLFEITGIKSFSKHNGKYTSLFCRPSTAISRSLSVDREILVLIASYSDIHARTLAIATEFITSHNPRLQNDFVIIIHNDPDGDGKLRAWGKEINTTCCPIYHNDNIGIPRSDALRNKLSAEIFSANPFSVTGPVIDDKDFYGRRNDAIEIHRILCAGRIHSIFGLRKTGKTSLVNRVIKIARQEGTLNIGVIDCSKPKFFGLRADNALRALAKVIKTAETRGYSNLMDGIKYQKDDIGLVFDQIFSNHQKKPLCIVIDEVDYITPMPPTDKANHWSTEFCQFWREIRFFLQEAQRQGIIISIVVVGVSTKFFNCAVINGEENPVLQFIPETYLAPFVDTAAISMIQDLGKRCGLRLDKDAAELIAKECGHFPYWIRCFCAKLHETISVESRPIQLGTIDIKGLLGEWMKGDAIDIATVALVYMNKMYPEIIQTIRSGKASEKVKRVMSSYGIADSDGDKILYRSKAFEYAASSLEEALNGVEQSIITPNGAFEEQRNITLSNDQWAEELAMINKARNTTERKLRSLIYYSLKFNSDKSNSWPESLLKCLEQSRRSHVSKFQEDKMLDSLYWRELAQVILKNWDNFEKMIGDKVRFTAVMDILNDRPDTHAKSVDLADIALYRRELRWIEEKI